MESELERLRKENGILKTCGCYIEAPLPERLAGVDRLADKFSIHTLCKTLNILRSTYYHHSLRRPEKTMYELNDEIMRPLVKEIFDEIKGRYGTRKLKAELEARGHIVSSERLRRYMKKLNIKCKQSQLKYFSSSNRKYMYRLNKLKQQFTQTTPNLVWVSDVTYVREAKTFYSICVIIDLFSRKVLAYEIATTNTSELIIATFRKASTEGFNNKIRWLIRQAYGFRDVFYLKLKIFQLPSIQPQKEL